MKPVAIAVLLSAIALSGCTAQPAPSPSATAPEVTAAETCEQYGNVLTVLFNAAVSQSQGRSTEQELDGARTLAHSMLEYTSVEPGSELEAILLRLRAIDPPDLMAVGSDSDEWGDADQEFGAACREAGSEVAIMAWTGG